jgi:hypothetical protein
LLIGNIADSRRDGDEKPKTFAPYYFSESNKNEKTLSVFDD